MSLTARREVSSRLPVWPYAYSATYIATMYTEKTTLGSGISTSLLKEGEVRLAAEREEEALISMTNDG